MPKRRPREKPFSPRGNYETLCSARAHGARFLCYFQARDGLARQGTGHERDNDSFAEWGVFFSIRQQWAVLLWIIQPIRLDSNDSRKSLMQRRKNGKYRCEEGYRHGGWRKRNNRDVGRDAGKVFVWCGGRKILRPRGQPPQAAYRSHDSGQNRSNAGRS
jgi:hypothetical protein